MHRKSLIDNLNGKTTTNDIQIRGISWCFYGTTSVEDRNSSQIRIHSFENDDFQTVESLFLNCFGNFFRFDSFIGFPCQRVPMDMYLGGGFKYFLFFHPDP